MSPERFKGTQASDVRHLSAGIKRQIIAVQPEVSPANLPPEAPRRVVCVPITYSFSGTEGVCAHGRVDLHWRLS